MPGCFPTALRANQPGSNVRSVAEDVLAVAPGPDGLSEGRGFIDRAVAAAGFDDAARYQIAVAANEAVSNAMEHGVPCEDGRLHLGAALEQDYFVFSVRDCGEFEHAESPAPEPVAERGRGFAFMNLLMDDVRLDAREGETVLRLAKRLPGASQATAVDAPADDAGTNERVVRTLFSAFAARDLTALMELVDRGVMLEPLSTPVERRTPYLGIAGLRRYLADLDATWEQFEVSPRELRAHGDHVVALADIRARRAGYVADDPAGFAFKLRNGRVMWAKVYASEEEALAAAGWA
jgi:serine/threonine-protein kinase RsbW